MTTESAGVVLSFMKQIIDEHDVDAAISLLADDFVSHQGTESSDRAGMEAFGRWLAEKSPRSRLDVHRVVDDGQLIAVHHTDHHDEHTAVEMVDIFSVTDGRITECWIVMSGPQT